MVDIASGSEHADNLEHPMGPFLCAVSLMHCMPAGLIGNGSGHDAGTAESGNHDPGGRIQPHKRIGDSGGFV